MNAADLHAEAHRLKAELGYGARRIAKELGITRYAAEQMLKQPFPAKARDARLEAVIGAVVGTVPYAVETDTVVTVEHRYRQGDRHACDTWTGSVERLAERIVAALDEAPSPEGPKGLLVDVPRLVVELRGPVSQDQVRRITTGLAAMIRPAEGVAR
ncbi:hypothetical protein GA0115233_100954 [Streptomyces sp. DI166]|uniref:hypothetical protein n=1 Tax=Streptomyces sp. DI166 TaxID=1839783 RepID=UPI0007F40281|nr:hypothetical protein [Streptomyces sp. DI166]SBT89407.1 hypothetical protein GA0115233_100954 [Streptomyces sp. DI166]